MGASLSDLDASKMLVVDTQTKELEEHFTGLKNTIALAVLPAISSILDSIKSVLPSAATLRDIFEKAVRAVVIFGAEAYDALKAIFGPFISVVKAAADFNKALTGSYTILGNIADIAGAVFGHSETADAANKMMDGWKAKLDDTAKAAEEHKGDLAAPFVAADKAAEKAQEKIAKALDSLQKEFRQLGMTGSEKKLDDIMSLPGLTTAQGNQAIALQGQIDEAEKHKKAVEQLKKLHDELNTFGMDEGQKKVYAAAHAGFSEDDTARLEAYAEQLSKLEDAKKSADAIQHLTDKIREQKAALSGQSESQKEIDEFKRRVPHATAAEVADFSARAKQSDDLAQMKKFVEEAKRLGEQGESPLQKYNETLEHLQSALKAGEITWDLYSRAIKKAGEELDHLRNKEHNAKGIDLANMSVDYGHLGAQPAGNAGLPHHGKGFAVANQNAALAGDTAQAAGQSEDKSKRDQAYLWMDQIQKAVVALAASGLGGLNN
jgi:hypothetical protein